MSESQERMMAVVKPELLDAFLAVDGQVGRRDQRARRGHRHRPPHHRLARRERSSTSTRARSRSTARSTSARSPTRPGSTRCRPTPRRCSPAPTTGDALREQFLALLGSANLADKGWITDQYDYFVRRQHRPRVPRRRRHDPRRRGERARLRHRHRRERPLLPARPEAGRAARARRGVPQRRRHGRRAGRGHRLPQLRQPGEPRGHVAVLADRRGPRRTRCLELEIPVTGGNVSFYNQTGDMPIFPTPVVGVLGVIDDVARRIPAGWQDEGENIYLLGVTGEELDGSAWAGRVHGHLGGARRRSTSAGESALAELLHAASARGLISSAHDLADGRPRARRSPRASCGSASARGSGSTEIMERDGVDAATALFSRVDRPRARLGPARGRREVPGPVRRPRTSRCCASASPTPRSAPSRCSRCRTCSRSRSTSCARPRRRTLPAAFGPTVAEPVGA